MLQLIKEDRESLWGSKRKEVKDWELSLEALAGWDKNNCGSGIIRCEKAPIAIVHNIVSTSLLKGNDMPINLQRLSMYLPNSSYNRRRFAAITIRIDNPHCTALLFTSGKLVITGVRSWHESLLASLCISRMVTEALVDCSYIILNCEIQNIVAHSEAPLQGNQKMDIQRMYESHSIECTFQRNMFPGLIYRAKECPVVLLCFLSGKVVLTGGKTFTDIEVISPTDFCPCVTLILISFPTLQVGWEGLWQVMKEFIW